ncbi:MAG TPA: SpoIIE family protein phosphatase, partial [Tepidisphaeraceae bacterium]|nr:SpoIIE family protein phosphatase [Tepidisphaeraceae bacterium]
GDEELGAGARVLAMEPGDALVLVTDGFFECCDEAGELLGISRLAEFIGAHCGDSAEELIAGMYGYVREFSGDGPQGDDLTAVVIKRRG